MTLQRFNEIWGSVSYPPQRVPENGLRLVEQQFNVDLPQDFRTQVLEAGLPKPTISLLDLIVEQESDLLDVSEFYHPKEMIQETTDWHEIGMPRRLLTFACDSSGNKFCFDLERLRSGCSSGIGVWFYDHDFEAVERIAPSFADWVDAFCSLEATRRSR